MDLPDYVRSIRFQKRLSLKDVEDRSRSRISKGYVHQIENRQIDPGSISLEKLEALALGIGVQLSALLRVAHGLLPDDPKERREVLAEKFDGQELSAADWQDIEGVIEFLVNQKKGIRASTEKREKAAPKSNFKRRKP